MGHKAAFSLRQALAEAIGFLPTAWLRTWLILGLLLAAGLLVPLLEWTLRLSTWAPLWTVAGQGLGLILKVIAIGALYRLAIFRRDARAEGFGFGGVQFGWPEARLLAAWLIAAAFLVIVAGAFVLIFLVAFNLLYSGEDYGGTLDAVFALFMRAQRLDWAFIVFAAAAGIVLLVLAARLALIYPATICERRIVALNALSLSEGGGIRMLTGLVVVLLPYPIAVLTSLMIRKEDVGTAFVNYGVYYLIAILLVLPLSAGFFASAYRQIRDNRAK